MADQVRNDKARHSSSSIDALQRSPQPHPARLVQFAPVALGRPALLDRQRRLGRAGGAAPRPARAPAGSPAFPRTAAGPPAPGPRTPDSPLTTTRARHGLAAQGHRVADLQLARRLGLLAVDRDAALADLLGRQRARLVEARAPQPLVDPQPVHRFPLWRAAAATVASSPSTRPCRSRLSSSMLPPSASHDLLADRPGPGPSRCAVAGGKGLEQALAQLGGDARPAVADRQGQPARRRRPAARASRPPRGPCRMALCSRLRVSSRSIHSCARTGAGCGVDLEVEVLLGDQRRQVQRHRAHRSRPGR